MNKIIITGATGFIGVAITKELLSQGDEVWAVIRPDTKKRGRLPINDNLHIVSTTLDELPQYVKNNGISADIFFHLAWNGSAGAMREDFSVQAKNIEYVKNALQAAKVCSCRKFVGAGSQAEYGVVHGKATEETQPNPFMMYGAAKVAACNMGRVLAAQLGIDFVWPRIYSVYGAGENDGTLLSYLVQTLKEGKTPELSPCENMWNFLYIDDCAKILATLGKTSTASGIYNVASGDTRLLKDFVNEARDIIAPGAKIDFGARASNPARTFWLEPDIGKLTKIYKLRFMTFAEGIKLKLADIHRDVYGASK